MERVTLSLLVGSQTGAVPIPSPFPQAEGGVFGESVARAEKVARG